MGVLAILKTRCNPLISLIVFGQSITDRLRSCIKHVPSLRLILPFRHWNMNQKRSATQDQHQLDYGNVFWILSSPFAHCLTFVPSTILAISLLISLWHPHLPQPSQVQYVLYDIFHSPSWAACTFLYSRFPKCLLKLLITSAWRLIPGYNRCYIAEASTTSRWSFVHFFSDCSS